MSTAKTSKTTQTATFAAGCFWGVEAAFSHVRGVIATRSGFTGGHSEHPSYYDVCTGTTGHAEAVEITYDPAKVSYQQLLDVFWKIHDPTQADRQGPDIGSQYRSAIFTHSPEQETLAKASLDAQQKTHEDAIATQIEAAKVFYPAEDHHQRYFERHGVSVPVTA